MNILGWNVSVMGIYVFYRKVLRSIIYFVYYFLFFVVYVNIIFLKVVNVYILVILKGKILIF